MTLTTRIASWEILASGVGTPRRLLFTVELTNRGADELTKLAASATAWLEAQGKTLGPAECVATAVQEELDVIDAGEIDHVEFEAADFGGVDTSNEVTVRVRLTLTYKDAAGANQEKVIWYEGPEGFESFNNVKKIVAPR